jgi:hypothetical protein
MGKHTPGPWMATGNTVKTVCTDIRSMYKDGRQVIANMALGWESDIGTYNARLIAAAPELLEALIEIVSQADQGNPGSVFARDACINRARAAIAKAT